jgi:hypothetical protein
MGGDARTDEPQRRAIHQCSPPTLSLFPSFPSGIGGGGDGEPKREEVSGRLIKHEPKPTEVILEEVLRESYCYV